MQKHILPLAICAGLVLLVVSVCVLYPTDSQAANPDWHGTVPGEYVAAKVIGGNTANIGTANTTTANITTANITTANVSGVQTVSGTQSITGLELLPLTDVNATTVTVLDASTNPRVNITVNAATTGVTFANGVTGQLAYARGTHTTNTVQFDDNASTLALGGNIALGENDWLVLRCTSTSPQQWERLFSSDN